MQWLCQKPWVLQEAQKQPRKTARTKPTNTPSESTQGTRWEMKPTQLSALRFQDEVPHSKDHHQYRPNPCIVLPTGSRLETDRMLGKWAIVQWMFLPNGVQRMFTSQHKLFQEKHSESQSHLQSHLQRVFSSVLSESFVTILPIETPNNN